jgi:ATP-dependent DNA helicase RecG
MAIFATTERITFNDLKRYSGSVFTLIDHAEKYIRNNIRWRVEFDGSIHRKEIPEIPLDAIREALINSFCHKDFRISQNNEVSIYKNRIEIYNPGIFPEGLTPADFIEGSERSVKRNPKIAQLLYYSKDVESFGTGLRRINDACMASDVKVHFQLLKTGFMVVFYRPEFIDGEKVDVEPNENTEIKIVKPKKPISGGSKKKATKKPNEDTDIEIVKLKKPISGDGKKKANKKPNEKIYIAEIIRYLQTNEYVTNKTAREMLNLADSTIKRILKNMVNDNLIVSFGERGQRKYALKK